MEPTKNWSNNKPPQFMTDLYHSVQNSDDQNTRKPHEADVIRALPEKDQTSHNIFKFSLNKPENEEIIEAELHLYRIGMKEHGTSYHLPYFLLRVYQVMPLPRYPYTHDPDFHQLLHIHYIPAYSTGWQVFKVKKAVHSWLNGLSPNLGLMVTATTILGEPVQIRFSRRGVYADTYQPSLILFTKNSLKTLQINIMKDEQISDPKNGNCQVQNQYIDFKSVGLNFIIKPTGFDINYCSGSEFCKFPDIFKKYDSIHHARIQAMLTYLGQKNDNKILCVPIDYDVLNILYIDNEENVIFKTMMNMSVRRCGCR